jgi:hypothetical protein
MPLDELVVQECFPVDVVPPDLPNFETNADLRAALPPVDGEVVSVENPLRLWVYDADGYAGIPDDDLTLIKPATVLLADPGRWVPAEGRAVAATFAQVRLAISGSCEILDVLGKATFDDGFQGIFDRQPVGAYVDDDTNVLVAGAFAYVRRGNLLPTTLPNGTTILMSAAVLPPGSTAVGSVVSIFKGGQTAADVNLPNNASTPVLVQVLAGLGASKKYNATLGFRVVMWQGGTEANSGSMDCVVDLYITTDGGSVATVVFQTALTIEVSRLPAALAGATMTAAASAGGFTISATRPAGVNCDCRAKWWVVEFEDIT